MDLLDCAILDWIIAMCNSLSPKVIANRIDGWTRVDYRYLLNDMPLLRIKSKGALTPRVRRIVENGYIETDLKDGEKMYMKVTEKVDELVFESVHETKHNRSRKRTVSVHENEPIIILSNHNTKSVSKCTFGEFEKVLLTDEEYQKLIEKMGEKNTKLLIVELDSYIAQSGKKYSSHYATILNWARRKINEHNKINSNIAF